MKLNETHIDVALINETYKKCIKRQYDKFVRPHDFVEGNLVLVYDQDHDKLGAEKLEPMWHGPCIVTHVLNKVAYELVHYDGIPINNPCNGCYLRKYYD
jgi:hypothetical protein